MRMGGIIACVLSSILRCAIGDLQAPVLNLIRQTHNHIFISDVKKWQ